MSRVNFKNLIDEVKVRKWELCLVFSAVAVGSAYRYHRCRFFRWNYRKNHAVAITGCDTGLGYSLALHSHEHGATVIAGVLHPDGPGALDLQTRGIRVVELDVTNDNSIRVFTDKLTNVIKNEKLKFHGLVNNAGIMIFGEFEWQLHEQTKMQIEVNLLGPMSVTKQLMPLLRSHSGRIINVSSHCALAPLPGLAAYGATKAGMQAWSTALRVELGKYGVKVVSFIPGSFAMESNICSGQEKHFDEMKSTMHGEAKEFYKEYFDEYTEYLKALSGDNGLQRLDNPMIYKAFDGALLDRRPSAVYKCEPWRYTFYHLLFRITPTYIRDWLVVKFMQMPSWKSGHRNSNSANNSTNRRIDE